MDRSKTRNLDRESGMNRVSGKPKFSKRRPKAPKPELPSSESEIDFSESEVERFVDIRQKDDSRRPRGKPPPKVKRNPNVRPNAEPIEEIASDVEEAKPEEPATTSSAFDFLISAAYRTGFVKRAFPKESTYIPDVGSMFTCLHLMTSVVAENSLLHEIFPAFTSIGLYAYYAHALFYHVLRVRDEALLLTRIERRCLRRYMQVGAFEAWPIATPLIGFFQAMGRVVVEGGKYGQVVPRFPSLGGLSGAAKNEGLIGLGTVAGVGRLPIMPAIHAMLHNYGAGVADFNPIDGYLYPITNKVLAADNPFLNLTSGAAGNADFQTLAFSSAWKVPREHSIDTFMKIDAQKRMLVRRWMVPEIPEGSDFSDLEKFLALDDAKSVTWIKETLLLSTAVNKFFPGSVNLAKIPPITRIESVTEFRYSRAPARAAARDDWFQRRNEWKAKFEGLFLRDDAALAYQSAFSTSVRSAYEDSVIPTAIAAPFEGRAIGPIFDDESIPNTELDGTGQPDPVDMMAALIESKLYDNKGGRA